MRAYILSLLSLCFSFIAFATASSGHSRAADEATRIEIDQKAGAFRFIIEGQEGAVLDAAGLHVNGDIEFAGQVIDTGEWNSGAGSHAP
jgi:hypothetical protein